jgi:hypothetical protein
MFEKLINVFKQKNRNSLSMNKKEYYRSLTNKDLVKQIIFLPKTSENIIKFIVGILITREKTPDLEFEMTVGLESCFQNNSDKFKIFEYLVKEKNILYSNIHKYAKNYMIDRYYDFFSKGSHWNPKNKMLKSSILTDFEIKDCAKIAMKKYKKYIEDSNRGLPF